MEERCCLNENMSLDTIRSRDGIHGIYAWEEKPEYPKYIFDNKKTDLENIKIYLLLHYEESIEEYELCKRRGLHRNMAIQSAYIRLLETMFIELFCHYKCYFGDSEL